MSSAAAGHRLVAHTADCVIEAWGPDRATCLVEALQGLVEEFAEVADTPTAEPLPLGAREGHDEELLVSLLEDVLYTIDVFAVVPVRFHLEETDEGGVAGDMEVVPARQVHLIGPQPKAVTNHGLFLKGGEEGWRCQVLLDV